MSRKEANIHVRVIIIVGSLYLMLDSFDYRITLLLGPPGCGKTTLLKALTGNLDKSLKVVLLPPPLPFSFSSNSKFYTT